MFECPYTPFHGVWYPTVPVTLWGDGKSILTSVLVDSGATVSLFHAEFAEDMGLQLESGKRVPLSGIGGKVKGYLHTARGEVNGLVRT